MQYIHAKKSCLPLMTIFSTVGICFCLSIFLGISIANNKATATISLQVVNSFSGTTSLLHTGSYCLEGTTYYTGKTTIPVSVSASTGSNYEVASGDIVAGFYGSGVHTYTHTGEVVLSVGDGLKHIPSTYTAGFEYVHADPLYIFLDTTAPSAALPIQPSLAKKINAPSVHFSRSSSEDNGSGTISYTLHISDNPAFISDTTYTTTQTHINIHESLLPTGNVYRYVESSDCAGNVNTGVTSFFTRKTDSLQTGASKSPTFHIDNVSLKGYTSNTEYICEGDIRGYVYAQDPHNVRIDVQMIGLDISYTYSSPVNKAGYYVISIEYINKNSELYLPPGIYTVQVTASHKNIGTKTYTYEAFHVTDKCRQKKIETTTKEDVHKQEHEAPPIYQKQFFDINKIAKQNTYVKILQKKDHIPKVTIDTQDPLSLLLHYPDFLQQTGADPHAIIAQLSLLHTFSASNSNKNYLEQLIHILQAERYTGLLLLMYFLCYDIEFYQRRIYIL